MAGIQGLAAGIELGVCFVTKWRGCVRGTGRSGWLSRLHCCPLCTVRSITWQQAALPGVLICGGPSGCVRHSAARGLYCRHLSQTQLDQCWWQLASCCMPFPEAMHSSQPALCVCAAGLFALSPWVATTLHFDAFGAFVHGAVFHVCRLRFACQRLTSPKHVVYVRALMMHSCHVHMLWWPEATIVCCRRMRICSHCGLCEALSHEHRHVSCM